MGNIYFCVSSSKGLIQRIVRRFTDSKVSHSFLVYYSSDFGTYWAIDVNQHGITAVPYMMPVSTQKNIYIFTHSKSNSSNLHKVSTYIGKKYDYTGLIGFAIYLITLKWFHRKIKNVLHGKKTMFCSEFITKFMQLCEITVAKNLNPSLTSPGDLLKVMLNKDSGFTQVKEEVWEQKK